MAAVALAVAGSAAQGGNGLLTVPAANRRRRWRAALLTAGLIIAALQAAGLQAAGLIVAGLIVTLTDAPARAHDFWIEPSTFHPRPDGIVALGLRVGQNYVGDPVPRQSSAIDRFFIRQVGPDGAAAYDRSVEGANNIDPAGFLGVDGRATAVVGYSSNGADIELPADKFEDYLQLYGLDAIIAERNRRGERARPGRERFFRYAKALLSGARGAALATQPLGFAYEIVPDTDPTTTNGPLRGRVLYDGRALAGALVEALWRDDPRIRLKVRSDARGGFVFALPRPGVWLIKSVHMVRAGFFASADWDSLWASLTFNAAMATPVASSDTRP